MERGEERETAYNYNMTVYFSALKHLSILQVLTKVLNKGEDVNAVLSNGEPPICEAVKNANRELVSVLIKGKNRS